MYRNRGKMPDINPGKGGGFRAPHYSHYWRRNFVIVRYDKTFVAIELISLLIIIATIFAVYLFAYQVPFEDPLSEIKNSFSAGQIVAIGISIIATALVTFLTRSSKNNLIIHLKIVAVVSILMILVLFGIKLNIDSQYNDESVFESFYEQYEQSENNDSQKLSISLSGIQMVDSKEAYIQDSMKAYTNFSVKSIFYMVIHIAIVILIFYLAHRLSTIEEKKEKVLKDDAVLFDDEKNVKY